MGSVPTFTRLILDAPASLEGADRKVRGEIGDLAHALGRLYEPAWTEHPVQQGVDGRTVLRRF